MAALILGLASNRESLRGVESLSAWLSSTVQKMFGIRGRISDTTLSEVAVVETILAAGKRYLLAIKGNQPETEKEADRIFATMGGPSFSSPTGKVRGHRVTHHLTVAEIPDGTLNFPSARAFLRVQRHVTKPDGELVSNECRTFITNVVPTGMPMKTLLAIVRSHWRCENNGHWTSDAILGEDKKRVRYARGPQRIAVVAICRMIAQNILGQLRSQSRQIGTAHLSWEDILFHVNRALTGAVRHRSTKEIVVCP